MNCGNNGKAIDNHTVDDHRELPSLRDILNVPPGSRTLPPLFGQAIYTAGPYNPPSNPSALPQGLPKYDERTAHTGGQFNPSPDYLSTAQNRPIARRPNPPQHVQVQPTNLPRGSDVKPKKGLDPEISTDSPILFHQLAPFLFNFNQKERSDFKAFIARRLITTAGHIQELRIKCGDCDEAFWALQTFLTVDIPTFQSELEHHIRRRPHRWLALRRLVKETVKKYLNDQIRDLYLQSRALAEVQGIIDDMTTRVWKKFTDKYEIEDVNENYDPEGPFAQYVFMVHSLLADELACKKLKWVRGRKGNSFREVVQGMQ